MTNELEQAHWTDVDGSVDQLRDQMTNEVTGRTGFGMVVAVIVYAAQAKVDHLKDQTTNELK